jgi:arylsulfatase A-like enzyme
MSAMSLLPTLLELAGLNVPADTEAPSLAASVRNGTEPEAEPVFSEIEVIAYPNFFEKHGVPVPPGALTPSRHVMVRDGRWKYVTTVNGGPSDPALFDLERDPLERRNIAAQPGQRSRCERLEALLTRAP